MQLSVHLAVRRPHEVFMMKINKVVAIKQKTHYVRKQLTPFFDVVLITVVVAVVVVA